MKKNHVHYVFLYINIGATAAYTTHEKKSTTTKENMNDDGNSY